MTSRHHPSPEILMAYAAGTLSNALSCVVACHLSMCGICAGYARRLEILGGLLLGEVETAPVGEAVSKRALAHWSAGDLPAEPLPYPAKTGDSLLPRPLARYLGMNGQEMPWKTVVDGVQQYRIELPKSAGQMRLLRLAPGKPLIEHPKVEGIELALVLQGVCSDETGEYSRGDVIEWAEDSNHQLRSSGDADCICLIASEAKFAERAEPHRILRLLPRKERLPKLSLARIRKLNPAIAASLALLFGIGVGWLLRGETAGNQAFAGDLIRIESNRLLAQGPLQTALDALPSGQTASASSDGQDLRLGVKMTFRSQAGDYCRQYHIAPAAPERYSGIACRTNGEWAVKIQALLPAAPSASQQIVLAGGADQPMDAVVGTLIDGDPLVGEDEAALLKQGWKKP